MGEKKLVPKRRFEGFEEEWKPKLIDDIAEINPPSTLPEAFEYVDLESVVGTELINHRTVKRLFAPSRAQRLAKKGDVFYQTVRPYQKNNYLFVLSETNYVFSTGYTQIRPSISSEFLISKVITKSFVNKVLDRCTGTSFPAINSNDLSNIEISIPSFKEQQKIGQFFKLLDERISNQERKIAKVKALKSAYLTEMFPQEDETVPKRRFKGFRKEWKIKKIGDLAEIVRGASPRPIQDPKWFDKNSEVGWLRIADVTQQEGRIRFLKERISKLGQKKTRVLLEKHLLLSIAATVGKPVINYVKTGVHDGFLIFMSPKFSLEYMYQWLEMFRPNWNKYGQPGSQVNLNSDIVKEQLIMIPNLEEQQKIGEFFKNLDNQITTEETKLEKLTKMKEAYLEEMFL